MNKKRFLFAAMAAALTLGACTRTQELDGFDQQEPEAQEAVGFDIYTRSSIETKAGYVGDVDLTAMKVTGFGVYGYVTSGSNWAGSHTTAKPDFMANQHVTFNGSSWVYSPVKYWPNQSNGVDGWVDNGTATSQGAIDRVSFFAYAPFVEHSALPFGNAADAGTEAAKVSPSADGILYVNASNETDSPKVVYRVAADPSNGVDLMYGVANKAYTAAMTTGGDDPGVVLGMPFTNMTKLTTGEKMEYNFKHALTKLSVKVDGYYDQVNTGAAGTNDVDPNTRIVIESVNLKTARLATWGTLDLNNTTPSTPNWAAAAAGATLSEFNSNAGYELPIASNLKYVDGNEANVTHFSQQPLGVTKTPQSLMGYGVDGTTPASLMFVPNTGGADGMTVTVTYKVITRDPNLKTGYSSVQNKITRVIATLGENAFKPGYATTLNLHLGMTTVKMSAEVAGWDEASPEGTTDLPLNVPTHAFSVSSTKKVEFAHSNLQYKSGTWSLMEHPWSTVGTEEATGAVSADYGYPTPGTATISLFGWGTSGAKAGAWTAKDPWNTGTTATDYGPAYSAPGDDLLPINDWGANIGTGWCVPSKDEWVYLLTGRDTDSDVFYAKAKVNSVNGLIIVPDDWQTSYHTLNSTNTSDAAFTSNEISESDWNTKLAANGAVFLPAAGLRNGTDVLLVGFYGLYWSSTASDSDNAYYLYFYDSLVGPDYGGYRNYAYSVRLVRVLE